MHHINQASCYLDSSIIREPSQVPFSFTFAINIYNIMINIRSQKRNQHSYIIINIYHERSSTMNISKNSLIVSLILKHGFKKENEPNVYSMNGYMIVYIPGTLVLKLFTPSRDVINLKHHSLRSFISTLSSCNE